MGLSYPKYAEPFPPELADSAPETLRMICEESAAAGKIVRQDGTTPNKAVVVTTNTDPLPAIGVIKSKVSPTYCVVCLAGVLPRAGLPIGRIFLGPNGDFTNVRPVTGRVQVLGYSYGNGFIRVSPELTTTELAS